MRKILSTFLLLAVTACNPPPADNIYRKEGRFPGGLNVPVSLIVIEWGGKIRVMGSGWLIDGGGGAQFSAKHVTDALMNSPIELGVNECKVFLGGRVYTCFVDRVPSERDAIVLKMFDHINLAELPAPYKIAATKLKVGDKVFVQGFHPHPKEIRDEDEKEGFKDFVVPILKTFYELREADPLRQTEVVFDNLEGRRVKPDLDSIRSNPLLRNEEKKALLEYENDSYIKILMARDHKFSFGGLSGGVALNEKGEAVGIITAQNPLRFEYDKDGFSIDPFGHLTITIKKQLFDTIYVTPIESVKDLYDYARQIR